MCRNQARETVDAIQPMQHGRKALKNMRPRPVPKKVTLGFRFWMLLVRRSPIFIYFYFMAVVSWLGFLRSPFFHVMYMLDFFRRPAGRLVRQSLVHGGPNLLRSFLLGCVVLVCFGFFSYEFFSPVVNEEQQVCRTPWQCISKHVMVRPARSSHPTLPTWTRISGPNSQAIARNLTLSR